jgi:phage tail sheath gpL-like
MTSISLVGLSPSDPVPGEYAEVNFAQGEASSGAGVYAALLVGGKLSTGSATADTVIYGPDTPVPLTGEADAIALFGAGSELHRKVRRFLAINTTTPLYAIAVSEGGSAAAATGTITIATTATGAATLRIYVGDEFVDVGIASGDTPTTIATNAVKAINGKTWWAVTATNSSGVITLTTRQKGLRANFVRYWAQIRPSAIGTTVSPTASTTTSGGTVSDDSTTALGTILPKRFYYIVSAAEDATQLGALLSQVNTQALAVTGIRQRVVAGSVDTLANAITISTGLNGARAELVWLAQSDVPPCEMAAHNAAIYTLEEAPAVPRCNFSSYGDDAKTSSNWKIRAPMSGASPTRSQIFAALNAGLTPIGVRTSGSTYLVKRITARFLAGNVVDYRIRDAHKVTVCDRYVDDLIAKAALTMRGKLLADDPKKNEPVPGPNVITPRVVKAMINRLTRDYGEDALLQLVDAIVAGTVVIRETTPTTRVSAQIPLTPIDILDQLAFQVNQVG